MSYQDLLQRKEVYEKNMAEAKARGDMTKSRKYQGYINEINVRLTEYEREAPKDKMLELRAEITKLNSEIVNLKNLNGLKNKEIELLKLDLDKIRHPEKYKTVDRTNMTKGKIECPNCHRLINEEDMVKHQSICIKTPQSTVQTEPETKI